jgi:hypothetical protein
VRARQGKQKNLENLKLNNASHSEIRQVADHMQEMLYREEMF